ncbi:MAG: GNAT family N-acetyltransferase [bacterium]|nr:GNAT family N-acetyltransferase [bacterium]
MGDNLTIRNMSRAEVDELVDWAAQEGWNPGLHDAALFWQTDPEAFIAAELENELIGGGSITSYNGQFGFIGFFIVKPEFRGRGFGNIIWHALNKRLLQRIDPGAAIGLDGVFEMQPYYAKSGFSFSHRDIRFQSRGITPTDDESVVPLAQVSFDDLLAYDSKCFPSPRGRFLQAWISQADSLALGSLQDSHLAGYGLIRRCGDGFKVGPLFADDSTIADKLFRSLLAFADGESVFLDVPENNPEAIDLAKRYKMQEVFGCARMYLGSMPELSPNRVFGVTTFEIG